MYDWVGGRTSEMSAVGLLPAALGIDIRAMLAGAKEMDATPATEPALLALGWAGNGRGEKMVVLPYKDSLLLFSRYLTVGDGIACGKNLDGQIVHQGIAVYGNKGSTDQHAYVQQLREGVPFFMTFIEVLEDRQVHLRIRAWSPQVYLSGLVQGTRKAL